MKVVDDLDLVEHGTVKRKIGLCGEIELTVNNDDASIVFVPISKGEIQAFLIERQGHWVLLNKQSPWLEPQLMLIERAINRAVPFLFSDRLSFALGTWHFGHLIGDHTLTLLKHRRGNPNNKLLVSPFSKNFTNKICRPIGCHIMHMSMGLEIKGLPALIELKTMDSIFMPADDKSAGLSALREVNRMAQSEKLINSVTQRLFLSSLRSARIKNIEQIVSKCRDRGWLVINPEEITWDKLSILLKNASQLIVENGSILFNTFALRDSAYKVLASHRCRNSDQHEYRDGGYVYNRFHDGVIDYIYCPCSTTSHHPYSDQIVVDPNLFD